MLFERSKERFTRNDIGIYPAYVFLYIIGVICAAFHVSHGFWSAFQTIGANHPKYMPFIKTVGLLISIILGAGFASLPVYVLLRY